jgi:hypothetical protein
MIVLAHESNRCQKLLLEIEKLECPVLLGPMVVRGTADSGLGFLPAKWHLTSGRKRTMTNPTGCGSGYEILLKEKMKSKEN